MDSFKMQLPDNIKEAFTVLTSHGFEAYAVGGCVRDCVMGIEPHDYDIASNALPDEVIECFSGYKTIETGKKHGTVTVVINGENIEITAFRIDGEYADHRHPDSVCFTRSLEEDLSRRDFTVNALAYNETAGLIDLFGGVSHIGQKIIACVGNPDRRFNEDGLRILRALRFSSVLGFSVENETAESIHRNRKLLCSISKERIYAELIKMLCGKNIRQIMLEFSDIFSVIIPEIEPCIGFDQKNSHHIYDVYGHIVSAIALSPDDKVSRLAALFHDIGKPPCFSEDENGIGHFYGHATASSEIALEVLRSLKVDNDTVCKVCVLVKLHDIELIPDEKHARRLLNKISYEQARRLLQLKSADTRSLAPEYHKRVETIEEFASILDDAVQNEYCFSLRSLAVSGDDLIMAGIPKGRLLGKILSQLLSKVIDGEIENQKNVLIYQAKLIYRQTEEE